MKLGYMARSNGGVTWHLSGVGTPRQQLAKKLGCSLNSMKPMYIDDTPDVKMKHVGYVVHGVWWTLYEVHEWVGAR